MTEPVYAVVLAAGFGKRMHSSLPKVLHPIAGLPMILHSLRAVAGVSAHKPVVIIGHGADQVRQVIGEQAEFALQAEQLGTAHALSMAAPFLQGETGLVLVVTGDMPLLTSETLSRLVTAQQEGNSIFTMLTVVHEDPHGFGRVLRGEDGSVRAIVEEAQASPEILAIRELNAGVYVFEGAWLWDALTKIPLSPKGEYYLTDIVAVAVEQGHKVRAIQLEDAQEALGINTRVHLAEVETVMRQRINRAWMLAGVSLVDPQTTYIDCDVRIAPETRLHPGVCLRGNTVIESGCEIGPFALIEDSHIPAGSRIGPYSHLRGGVLIPPGAEEKVESRG